MASSWEIALKAATGKLELERPLARLYANLVTDVYFTHGDRRARETGAIRLGKAWLVARLQTLLQTDRLYLPRNPVAEDLTRDLINFKIKVAEDANERYGAFRVGTHDDLVTALGLATQGDGRPTNAWAWAADYMRKRGERSP